VTVALTGATGFLGLHLLPGLLAGPEPLVVLARRDASTVLERIAGFLTLAGVDADLVSNLPDRVRVVRADVTQPHLGLSPTAHDRLTDELSAVWHSAGDVTQDGDLARLRRVNVEGTRNVLGLARGGARYFHVSTAFVAGRRRYGTVYDDELTDAYGFETPYERSKYEAELAVRDWAAGSGRAAVVFRPSVLASHLPPGPYVPSHPTLFAYRALRAITGDQRGGVVRIAGHPDSHVNVMPAEDAAAVMSALAGLGVAERRHPDGIETYHVVHRHELPFTAVLDALTEALGIRFTVVAEVPDPSPLEVKAQMLSAAWAYAHHRRRYDDARVRSLVDVEPSSGRLGHEYLLAGMGRLEVRR
jgi:nucleoside-diphosphate-sugar epimerase